MFRLQPSALDVLRVDDHSSLYVFDYTLPGRSERYLGHGGGFCWRRAAARLAGVAAARAYPHPFTLACFGLEGSYVADTIVLYPRTWTSHASRSSSPRRLTRNCGCCAPARSSRVVALHGRGFESLIPIGAQRSLFREPMRLFQVPDPAPAGYLVGTVQVGSDDDALRFLTDPARDLRARSSLRRDPRAGPGVVRGLDAIELLKPDRVRLAVEANGPATVVLVDTFDPGWTVTVNGKPAGPGG